MKLLHAATVGAIVAAALRGNSAWAVSAASSASDVEHAKTSTKRTVSLTTADLFRLVGSADRAKAHFREARRNRRLADQAVEAAGNGNDAADVDVEGGLRFLTGSNNNNNNNSCKDKLDKCRADRDTCQAQLDDPSLLFVQMAQTCKLKQKTNGKGKTYYELSSKDFDDDTYSFTDRPYRTAGSMSTRQFFGDFDTTFSEETGGRPNAAVTFRHADIDNFEGPLITVFVEAAYRKDSGKYVYELTQSEEQEKVHALEDFFRKGDGKDDGVVEYEMCSLFIDSEQQTCNPANVDSCNNWDCAYQQYAEEDGNECEACMCYNPKNYNGITYSDTFCESSVRTENKGKCVDKRLDGDGCHVSWQCLSGFCGDGKCDNKESSNYGAATLRTGMLDMGDRRLTLQYMTDRFNKEGSVRSFVDSLGYEVDLTSAIGEKENVLSKKDCEGLMSLVDHGSYSNVKEPDFQEDKFNALLDLHKEVVGDAIPVQAIKIRHMRGAANSDAFIEYHTDESGHEHGTKFSSVVVALNDNSSVKEGGELYYLREDGPVLAPRAQGKAFAHSYNVVHGVSPHVGERVSLILHFNHDLKMEDVGGRKLTEETKRELQCRRYVL